LQGGLDIVAIALMAAALIALFRFKVGLILVIFMPGLIGLLSQLMI
jgi:hypothetical protein